MPPLCSLPNKSTPEAFGQEVQRVEGLQGPDSFFFVYTLVNTQVPFSASILYSIYAINPLRCTVTCTDLYGHTSY